MMDHPTYKPDGGQSEREQYYNAVNLIVDEIEKALNDDSVGTDISELVWESIDASQYIMYYDQNLDVLQFSQNQPGEWKHLVSDSDSWRDVIQAMAYKTMEQDVWDEIRERDLE